MSHAIHHKSIINQIKLNQNQLFLVEGDGEGTTDTNEDGESNYIDKSIKTQIKSYFHIIHPIINQSKIKLKSDLTCRRRRWRRTWSRWRGRSGELGEPEVARFLLRLRLQHGQMVQVTLPHVARQLLDVEETRTVAVESHVRSRHRNGTRNSITVWAICIPRVVDGKNDSLR